MKLSILYISYDGMMEPLGQSQVLSYLERLAEEYSIHLISFEKKHDWVDRERREEVRGRITSAGIAWTPLAYHKTPTAPATAFDIAAGTFAAVHIAVRKKVDIVHARSYVPALMALTVQRVTGAKFVFDMRGFWADERVDGNLWSADGKLFRTSKRLERTFLTHADHVVSLTYAAADEIRSFPYLRENVPTITVIPTCADLASFNANGHSQSNPFTVGYVGTVGTWQLFGEVLSCFRVISERRPDARLLVVNRGEHDYIRTHLRDAEISEDRVEIVAAEHKQVPAFISRMTVGTALRKPKYSQLACAPTKLAEYLGCGVPCLANRGVGDVEPIIEGNKVGIVFKDFSDEEIRSGIERMFRLLDENDIRERCVDTAWRLFSVTEGVNAYASIYESLARSSRAARSRITE